MQIDTTHMALLLRVGPCLRQQTHTLGVTIRGGAAHCRVAAAL